MVRYDERQWKNVDLPRNVYDVPSMLSYDERKLLFYLASETFSGSGRIIDGGCFLGGSTLALGEGLKQNSGPVDRGVIHSFDMFILDEYMARTFVGADHQPAPRVGESCRQAFEDFVRPVANLVSIHEGDIRQLAWDGQPIEILFLDILKSWDTNDWVLTNFFPALIPGKSLLVQQDYVHEGHYWIHITMERLSKYFSLIEFVEFSSTVYILREAIPTNVLRKCLSPALSKRHKRVLMEASVNRWQGYPRGVLECTLALLDADLGDARAGLRRLQRVRNDYSWSSHVLLRAEWNENRIRGLGPVGP